MSDIKRKLIKLANYLNKINQKEASSQIRKMTTKDLEVLAEQLPWKVKTLEFEEEGEEGGDEEWDWDDERTQIETINLPSIHHDDPPKLEKNKWIEHRLEQPFGAHIIKEIPRPEGTVFIYRFFGIYKDKKWHGGTEDVKTWEVNDPFSRTPINGWDYEARVMARNRRFEQFSTLKEAKHKAIATGLEFLKDQQRYVVAMNWLKDMPSEKSKAWYRELETTFNQYLTGTSQEFKVAWDIFLELEHAKEAERLDAERREKKRKADEEYEIDMEITRMKEDKYYGDY